MLSGPKILITVPCEHWMRAEVVSCLLKFQRDDRYHTSILMPCYRPIENNQHHNVVTLWEGGYDFWLSIDADNPPVQNPLDLVELDKDLIGLPTPVFNWQDGQTGKVPIYWNGYDWIKEKGAYREHKDRDGLQEVDAIGGGCFLASRRVFEPPIMRTGCFKRTLRPNGTAEFGNDLAFCQRVKREGFKIYCHYDYPCRHFCEIDLFDMSLAIKGLLEPEVETLDVVNR